MEKHILNQQFKYIQLRDKSKKHRNVLTDQWQKKGHYSQPFHYINTTREMKKAQGIDWNKQKDKLNYMELKGISNAEGLASMSIDYYDIEGRENVHNESVRASEHVMDFFKGTPNKKQIKEDN